MSAPGKLVRSSRWKTGPSKGQRECCVTPGDSGREAYTAIAWGVGLSPERSDIAGAESFHSLEGVKGHITCKRIAPEPGISRVWPPSSSGAEYGGPHREGEEP
jgi:hypothetical protein